MPGRDNTGPLGTGPIGRGLGPCGGGQAGRGRGRGFGRRMGPGFAPVTGERESLEQQKNWLETQLDAINQHLKELEDKKE